MPLQFLQGPMVQVPFIHLSCNQEGSLNSEPFLGVCEVGHLFQAGYLRTLSAFVSPLLSFDKEDSYSQRDASITFLQS